MGPSHQAAFRNMAPSHSTVRPVLLWVPATSQGPTRWLRRTLVSNRMQEKSSYSPLGYSSPSVFAKGWLQGQACVCVCVYTHTYICMVFPGGSVVKNLPTMQETWVRSLSQEDHLQKEMANPLQYLCLGNPMDRGAWWVTVHRVTKELDMTYMYICVCVCVCVCIYIYKERERHA